MPIIVRELVVRARVEETQNVRPDSSAQGMSDRQIERIVALCVEKTLLTLKRNKER